MTTCEEQNLGVRKKREAAREMRLARNKGIVERKRNRPMSIISQFTAALRKELLPLPEGFYDTFDFTETGKNYTHPISLGILSRILSSIAEVEYVAVDFRLNKENAKFQPDLVAISQICPLRPVLFLDYESPNSSDMRIPKKDVNAYQKWSKDCGRRIPYFIVTTLPNRAVANWKLRWTARGQTNFKFRGRTKEVCKNPFRFWYNIYRKALRGKDLNQIHFINIDGKKVEHVRL